MGRFTFLEGLETEIPKAMADGCSKAILSIIAIVVVITVVICYFVFR